MNYRTDRYGNKLSVLGFGCMRFKRKGAKIDYEKAEKEILHAINHGVNYFDSAYIYPGSEVLLGEVLEKNGLRDKIYIATKLPHYLIKSRETMDKLFEEQLKRLRTDHIDYYLMHMLADKETWERLCSLGISDWIREKKESGAIRQIGFSYHGNTDSYIAILDAYDWDFSMIQYNYMDEHSQAGRRGLHYAAQKGLPVFIMEPLRGGRLAHNLPKEAEKLMENHKVRRTPAEWAFRWLWNQPEVTVALSGMNSLEMIDENLRTASNVSAGEFTEEDTEMLQKVTAIINAKIPVGCTGCGYCMPCPMQVDIPGTFAAYNRLYSDGRFTGLKEYLMCTALRKNSTAASRCIGCGKCETHCPQAIPIRKELKNAQKELEGALYKTAAKLAKLFTKF